MKPVQNNRTFHLWLTLALFLCFIPVCAFAQDAISLDTRDAVFSPMHSADEKALAVIQKRPFSKSGRVELSLGLGTIASDIFLVYVPVTLRGAYHFKEWVSLELSASFMGCFGDEVGKNQTRAAGQRCMRFLTPSYNKLTGSEADLTKLRSLTLREYQVARFGLNPVFSPFMGKFALADRAIAHFDVNLTAGIGVLLVEALRAGDVGQFDTKAAIEGNLGVGVRFVFLKLVGLRMDFRQYLYGKQRDKGLGTASEFTLGVSFLL